MSLVDDMAVRFGQLEAWTRHTGSDELTKAQMQVLIRAENAFMEVAMPSLSSGSDRMKFIADIVTAKEAEIEREKALL